MFIHVPLVFLYPGRGDNKGGGCGTPQNCISAPGNVFSAPETPWKTPRDHPKLHLESWGFTAMTRCALHFFSKSWGFTAMTRCALQFFHLFFQKMQFGEVPHQFCTQKCNFSSNCKHYTLPKLQKISRAMGPRGPP